MTKTPIRTEPKQWTYFEIWTDSRSWECSCGAQDDGFTSRDHSQADAQVHAQMHTHRVVFQVT